MEIEFSVVSFTDVSGFEVSSTISIFMQLGKKEVALGLEITISCFTSVSS
jgi:hypothetical protein